MNSQDIAAFQDTVLAYYDQHGRHELPWRIPEEDGTFSAYKIAVSEIMLQQTQVPRVIDKYQTFLRTFPTVQDLARAPLSAVLTVWSGLGYNRRAKFLWQAAQAVVLEYDGVFPDTKAALVTLTGIGPNTAGAILAYAYNQPSIFIETNIRSVFIHHFFTDQQNVSDATLLTLIEQAVPNDVSRTWYWALMDYGTFLKRNIGNASRASSGYAKQSAFQGSRRQVRGLIIRRLTTGPHSIEALIEAIGDSRLNAVLDDLQREGLIQNSAGLYRLDMV
jgi:A/G-specific adenine glycosylase